MGLTPSNGTPCFPGKAVVHRRSGWFDCTEPSLPTALQGKQDGSVPSNHPDLLWKNAIHLASSGGSSRLAADGQTGYL